MAGFRGFASAALVVSTHVLVLASVRAEEKDPVASPCPSPSPGAPGGIAASVDRVVGEIEEARLAPCRLSAEAGTPCFSASVEAKAPVYSVASYLRELHFGKSGHSATGQGGITIDPVCSVKHVLKKLKKKNDTYYLYRVWDRSGEHAVMRERPFDPAVFQGIPEFHFELLGKVDGECAAVASFARADHLGSRP